MNEQDFQVTKSGLHVPAGAVERRRIVMGLGAAERLRRAVRDLAKHKTALTMLCTEPSCKDDPVCERVDTRDGEGKLQQTELVCRCTVRVVTGGL